MTTYDLAQNYPNPFNPATVIKYQVPKDSHVSLKVYDILGREVATLIDGFKSQGRYNVTFNAGNLASGVYIYQLRADDFVANKKLILMK
ncbi:MAG TPA: T9SS type A sorting domain-containing protein [Ignavibacteriaceae bacterium]|nr:T9SS type A sorting domain-containing protein [Ignavibacteriaceae bacterium]